MNIGDTMNKKGFTLIELLVVLVIIGLIGVIAIPTVISAYDEGKKAAYQTLIKDIAVAAQSYYQECDYDMTSFKNRGGKCNDDAAATSVANPLNISLNDLVTVGLLTNSYSGNESGSGSVPTLKNDQDQEIGDCRISIRKNVDSNYKVTYTITNISTESKCPASYQ